MSGVPLKGGKGRILSSKESQCEFGRCFEILKNLSENNYLQKENQFKESLRMPPKKMGASLSNDQFTPTGKLSFLYKVYLKVK